MHVIRYGFVRQPSGFNMSVDRGEGMYVLAGFEYPILSLHTDTPLRLTKLGVRKGPYPLAGARQN